MTQFKYPHFLLGSVVVGLWFAGEVYATQSPVTPGPSVGHRPVMTNLVLATKVGPANGVITDSAAILSVGSTIELLSVAGSPSGVDVDGDEDKAGAYCVWYKVPAGGGTPVLIQDNGPTDRSCKYTIQMSDVGFKIKADVTIFSDTDKAQAKGYTINPIESMAATQISFNTVRKPPYIKGFENPQKKFFAPTSGFPQTLLPKATFQVIIDDGDGKVINDKYSWSISDTANFSISNNGMVTIDTVLSLSDTKKTIEARALDGSGVLTYEFKTGGGIASSKSSFDRASAESWCKNNGLSLGVAHTASIAREEWGNSLNGTAPSLVWVSNHINNVHFTTYNFSTGKITSMVPGNTLAGAFCHRW